MMSIAGPQHKQCSGAGTGDGDGRRHQRQQSRGSPHSHQVQTMQQNLEIHQPYILHEEWWECVRNKHGGPMGFCHWHIPTILLMMMKLEIPIESSGLTQ